MAGPGYYISGDEEKREVMDVLESGYLSRYGKDDDPAFKKKVITLEKRLAETIGVKYALAVNSGTSAIMAALKGVGVGPGTEVLVPGYTWVASIAAVAALGARPVLVEIDESLTVDPGDVEKKITPRTRALLPVHILGYPCDLEPLLGLAKSHGVALVEDVCQAMGATYRGRQLGSLGEAGAYSLNIFKTLNSGEGGFVTTDDLGLYERAFAFHDQGFLPMRRKFQEGDVLQMGINMKMNELTGAYILGQLTKLERIIRMLREKKRLFKDAILEGGIRNMETEKLNDPGECAVVMTVRFETAETAARVAEALGTRTLQHTGWHNYNLMSQLLAYRDADGRSLFQKHDLPRTDDLLARTIALSVGVTNPGLGAEFGINILSEEEEILREAERFVSKVKPIVD